MPVLFGGHNLLPLVEIGLTDLPKSGGAMATPAPPGTTEVKSTYACALSLYVPPGLGSNHVVSNHYASAEPIRKSGTFFKQAIEV